MAWDGDVPRNVAQFQHKNLERVNTETCWKLWSTRLPLSEPSVKGINIWPVPAMVATDSLGTGRRGQPSLGGYAKAMSFKNHELRRGADLRPQIALSGEHSRPRRRAGMQNGRLCEPSNVKTESHKGFQVRNSDAVPSILRHPPNTWRNAPLPRTSGDEYARIAHEKGKNIARELHMSPGEIRALYRSAPRATPEITFGPQHRSVPAYVYPSSAIENPVSRSQNANLHDRGAMISISPRVSDPLSSNNPETRHISALDRFQNQTPIDRRLDEGSENFRQSGWHRHQKRSETNRRSNLAFSTRQGDGIRRFKNKKATEPRTNVGQGLMHKNSGIVKKKWRKRRRKRAPLDDTRMAKTMRGSFPTWTYPLGQNR